LYTVLELDSRTALSQYEDTLEIHHPKCETALKKIDVKHAPGDALWIVPGNTLTFDFGSATNYDAAVSRYDTFLPPATP
jgi:hypothetical protein